jgi:hypothetical protein
MYAIEAAATEILICATRKIPDLLQTRDYAQALADADPILTSDTVRDQVVETLMIRQDAVLKDCRPDITVLLTEAAIREPVGGLEVMRGQIARLAEVASDSATISIHILPNASRTVALETGSMTILRFPGAPGIGTVHIPGPQGGRCIDDPRELASCWRAFEHLKAHAYRPAKSAILLRQTVVK